MEAKNCGQNPTWFTFFKKKILKKKMKEKYWEIRKKNPDFLSKITINFTKPGSPAL